MITARGLLGAASWFVWASAGWAAEPGYYSQPALHGQRLVFVCEGDLWTLTLPEQPDGAPLVAHRLTSSDGREANPQISPDGRWLAFSAQYDGNTDVYVMPLEGGAPVRLTFHPSADVPLGWQPDGRRVYFRSARHHPLGRTELYEVSVSGGMPERFGFGECSQLALSATGKRFAFTRWSNENWTWKRYRGGTAPEIWIGNFAEETFTQLTDDPASDLFPMWILGRAYFISDRTGTANVFSDNPRGGDLKQHTFFAASDDDPTAIDGYDVRWPSSDAQLQGRRIVFTQAGALALLDVTNDRVTRLDVRVASDRVAARQRFADPVKAMTSFGVSPDGRTLLIEARGEVLAIDLDSGESRQLTRTSQAREWGASFIDADRIVLITDEPGEQQLAIVPADASEGPGLVTQDREGWLFPPRSSPDGQYLAYADQSMRLHVVNLQTLGQQLVDRAEGGEITDYRFSPDSQWLAYTRPEANGYAAVHLYALRTGRTFQISHPLHLDHSPRWDPAGKYLFYLSERHFDPLLGGFDMEHVYPRSTRIVALPLAEDTPPPVPALARRAEFDLEAWANGGASEGDAEEGDVIEPIDAPAQAAPPMRVQTDNIGAREFVLPIPPGDFRALEVAPGMLYFVEQSLAGLTSDESETGGGVLHRYNLVEEEGAALLEGVQEYAISGERDLIVARVADGFTRFALPAAKPEKLQLDHVRLRIDAPAEWAQILDEAWRLQRDFYWAPNMVGVDWPAMRTKYESLLPRVATRDELTDLIGQLIGELGTSHTYIWGGERYDRAEPIPVGLLGIDIDADRGARIARILPAPGWDGSASPLAAAHLDVAEGSFITALDGQPVGPQTNIYDLLQGQADRAVRLTVADDAAGANARTVEVETIGSEVALRYEAWVEGNRRYVHEQSGGTIGYLHIPNMGGDGLQSFSRQFYPQSSKSALIIDVRNNGGGFVSEMIIRRLAATVHAFSQPRHGATTRYPSRGLHAHMACLIDQHAGSDGDIFPAMFRARGLGSLIGTRTWGGVVGIRGDKPFVDMGLSTQPEYAWWDATGGWTIENRGVSPDIEVDITPSDRLTGSDPQLDRGIEVLLQQLLADPKQLPEHPPYPIRD